MAFSRFLRSCQPMKNFPHRQAEQKGFATLSRRLAYMFSEPENSIAIFGNNLTNKHYSADAGIGSQGSKGIYAPPRTYGL